MTQDRYLMTLLIENIFKMIIVAKTTNLSIIIINLENLLFMSEMSKYLGQ